MEIYKPSSLKESVFSSLKGAFYNTSNPYATRPIAIEGTIVREPSIYGPTAYFYIEDEQKVQLNVKTPKNLVQGLQKGILVQLSGTVNLNSKPNGIDYDIIFSATTLLNQKMSPTAQKAATLTQELYDLGYFSNKKPFPNLQTMQTCRISVITSGNASANAMADVEGVMKDVAFFELTLVPVNLGSVEDISRGIREADSKGFDILLLTRGGGEQLDVFNERPILEALHEVKGFTISAIGHAKDNLLSDMVSDHTARTPTDAARYLVERYSSTLTYQQFKQLQQSNTDLNKSLGELYKLLDISQKQASEKEILLQKIHFQVKVLAVIALSFAGLFLWRLLK